MKLKVLLCTLYLCNFSFSFILNRENSNGIKRSPMETEHINYGSGQSGVSTKALTLADLDDEVVGKRSPYFTVKEKRCPRNGERVGAVLQPVAAQQINRRDLQSTINKRLCETCKASNTCSKLGNCDYCSRWCEKIEEQTTTTESLSTDDQPNNIVGQIHEIRSENIEFDPTKVSSRFGGDTNTVGQTNIEAPSTMPKYYVLGRLDAIMAIEIISKILGVQNPEDIKQLLILGSTKSDNPPVFGPSMHNISPEKASILTQALNNELDKIIQNKADSVLTNDDLNTAIENAIQGLQNGNTTPAVVGSAQEEKVGCFADKKDDVVDDLPVYPVETYQPDYRHENGAKSDIKNPDVIEDVPEMPNNVKLGSRLNDASATETPTGINETTDNVVASPIETEQVLAETKKDEQIPQTIVEQSNPDESSFHKKRPKFPGHHFRANEAEETSEPTVEQSNPDSSSTFHKKRPKFPGHRFRANEAEETSEPTVEQSNPDSSSTFHKKRPKFPGHHFRANEPAAEETSEPTVEQSNPDPSSTFHKKRPKFPGHRFRANEAATEETSDPSVQESNPVTSPTFRKKHPKFPGNHFRSNEPTSTNDSDDVDLQSRLNENGSTTEGPSENREHIVASEQMTTERTSQNSLTVPPFQKKPFKFPIRPQVNRANQPILGDKEPKPSRAMMTGRTRQFTLIPTTTERILESVTDESNTLSLHQNERPKLLSASHVGTTPDENNNLGATNPENNDNSNILTPMRNGFMDDSRVGAGLGRDIVKLVEDNVNNENVADPIEGQSQTGRDAFNQGGHHLGEEIVKVVENNLEKQQNGGGNLFKALENQMKQSRDNLRNLFAPSRPIVGDTNIPQTENPVNIAQRVPEIQTENPHPIIVQPSGLIEPDNEEVGAPQMPEEEFNQPIDVEEIENVSPEMNEESPDMVESRMQTDVVGDTLEEPASNHFGKIVPVEGNSLQPPSNVFFLGNGIKLPLRMHQNKDGTMEISVDLDRLCSCQNSTCPKNHDGIVETVGTILEKEAELKNQLESIDATNNEFAVTTQPDSNKQQIRRDLKAVDVGADKKFDHVEMFKRASSPFIPQSSAGQMSQFLSNDLLSTTPKQYPTLNDIVQMRDMYKYKKLEQELANKLQALNRNVEQYKDENTKLFNRGAKTIFKTNDENVGVQKQVDILNNVLGWMKTVALTNTKHDTK